MRVPTSSLLLLLCLVLGPSPSAGAQEVPPPGELAAALRRGGLVLYMRHPATGEGQADADPLVFEDCATQRNLSDGGRRIAAEVGAALRAVRAQVGRAVTSEYCRARETAGLMGVAGAEVDAALNDGGRMQARGPGTPQAEALRAILRTAPPRGEVTLVVAHRPNLVDAAGPAFANLGEAEIAVFRPAPGEPGFEALARIRPEDWQSIVAAGG